MVEVRPDSFLSVDVDLGQEDEADSNKQPLVEVGEQQNRVNQQETAITDDIKPAYNRPHIQRVML